LNTTFYILSFIFGTLIGSFLSVLLYRTKKKKKGIVFGRSKCPHCQKALKSKHLIPMASYIIQSGKCSYCKEKIPFHYFLLELISGSIFLILFLNFPFIYFSEKTFEIAFSLTTLLYFINISVIFSILILIGFYDYLYQEIPFKFSIPLILITLIFVLLRENVTYFNSFIGLLIFSGFFGIQYVVSKGKWIGGGDIYLGAGVGLLLGWPFALVGLVSTYILGSIIGIFVLIKNKFKKNLKIAFGPFIILGTLVTYVYGQEIIDSYLKFIGY
jgi:leader peptidase (prepilin peptidase) / N-methyltransferase